MVDIKLDTIDAGMLSSKDLYVAVRIGESQKLTRVSGNARKFTFPEKSFANRSYGKLEVFRHIGSCTFATNGKLGNSVQELSMNPGAGLDDLRFRVSVGNSEESGIPPSKLEKPDKCRSEAQEYLEKHQLQLRLADVMHGLLRERPDDPVAFVNSKLQDNKHIVKEAPTIDTLTGSAPCTPVPPVPDPKPAADVCPAANKASSPEQSNSADLATPVSVAPVSAPVQPVTVNQPVLPEQLEQSQQLAQTQQLQLLEKHEQPVQTREVHHGTSALEKKDFCFFDETAAVPLQDLVAEMRTALEKSIGNGLLDQTLKEMSFSDVNRQAGSLLAGAATDGHLSQLLADVDQTPEPRSLPGTAEVRNLLMLAADDGRLQDFLQSIASPSATATDHAPPAQAPVAAVGDDAWREARSALMRAIDNGSLAEFLKSVNEGERPPPPPSTALSRVELSEVCQQAREALANFAASGQLSEALMGQIMSNHPTASRQQKRWSRID